MSKPFSFAHLFGVKKSASEEDEQEKENSKSKGKKAEDDENGDEKENSKSKSKKAEGDDDDGENEKSKSKSKKAEDDDDDTSADDGDSDDDDKESRKARKAERQRCARIFGSQYAASNPALAASLAFNTGMSSSEAITIMSTTGTMVPAAQSRKRSLDERMRAEGDYRVGQDNVTAEGSGQLSLVNKMTGLYNSIQGK